MIDFRYHLVSIIAIFMALAVGIVLGAGPLKEDIGATLTSELTRARQDKADLNAQLAASRSRAEADNQVALAGRPALVAGRLEGQRVVVVSGVGADDAVVKAVTTSLTEAGASVARTVRLGEAWTRPGEAAALAEGVQAARGPLGVGETVADKDRPGAVLGRALLAPTERREGEADVSADVRSEALSGLASKGLLTVAGSEAAPATLAVVVPGPLVRQGTESTTPQTAAWTSLVRGLDAAGDGSVLVTPTRPVDDHDQISPAAVLVAVRGDRAAGQGVSTVDDGELVAGQVATVWALQEQRTGATGRYGIGEGAQAVLPQVAAP